MLTKLLPSHRRLIQEKRNSPHQEGGREEHARGRGFLGAPGPGAGCLCQHSARGAEPFVLPDGSAVGERTCGASPQWASAVPRVWLPSGLVLYFTPIHQVLCFPGDLCPHFMFIGTRAASESTEQAPGKDELCALSFSMLQDALPMKPRSRKPGFVNKTQE